MVPKAVELPKMSEKISLKEFCHLIVLVLSWNVVKGLRVTKNAKEITLEGVFLMKKLTNV